MLPWTYLGEQKVTRLFFPYYIHQIEHVILRDFPLKKTFDPKDVLIFT
jgi:hypothetical protein